METIKLFRGDSTKVPEFKTKKTNSFSLLGEGIYLTDSTKIASSYRKKDAGVTLLDETYTRSSGDIVPFNRITVLEEAYGHWLEKNYRDEVGYWIKATTPKAVYEKKLNQFKALHRAKWQKMVETNCIKVSYLCKDTIRVEERLVTDVGYTSVFEFFAEEFDPRIFKVDGRITDQGFIDFATDQKIFESTPRQFDAGRAYDYRRCSNSLHVPTQMYCHVNGRPLEKLRRYLKGRNFKGMEYSGGILIGGYGTHRAFCVWDDEWVNYHKTNRYK